MTHAGRAQRLALAGLLAFASVQSVQAATRYDWQLRFRVLPTPHFLIYYHQREEDLARRLAATAEDVHHALDWRLRAQARGRTHVILVDQHDLANGWATPLPYNTIELSASSAPADSVIGHTGDWLRLVFIHEYTHILHLDRSRGWAAGLRRVFGRSPWVLPNLYLPQWQIEGLATFYESRQTGEGRLHAGDFRVMLDEAQRAGRFEPLDRINGGLVAWPDGSAPYLYGAEFHQYLADRFGERAIQDLANSTAGSVPYFFADARFRDVFGRSVLELWHDFRASVPVPPPATGPPPTRLTHRGHLVTGPRWDRGPLPAVLFSTRSPHGFPAIERVTIGDAQTEHIASRYLGERLSVADEVFVFDQMELVRDVAVQSDLYVARRDGQTATDVHVTRLTRHGRVSDPDLAPDGRTIACVVTETGRRSLALIRLAGDLRTRVEMVEPTVWRSEADAEYLAPRWSPDGRTIAVARRRRDGPSQLVLVDPNDPEGRGDRVLVSLSGARIISPAWVPGPRTVLFATDAGGGPFNLHAIELEDGAVYQVTNLPSGAHSPDVSPDGRTIVFVGYTHEGYDLFTLPLDRASWTPRPALAVRGESPASTETGDAPGPPPHRAHHARRGPRSQGATLRLTQGRPEPVEWATSEHIGPYVSEEQRRESLAGPPTRVSQRVGVQEGCSAGRMPAEFHHGLLGAAESRSAPPVSAGSAVDSEPYRPWTTLLPRYWMPEVSRDEGEWRLGASTSGQDVLGRHRYAVDVAKTTGRNDVEWTASYVYDRWKPALFLSAARDTAPPDGGGGLRAGGFTCCRSLEANAGAVVPWNRVRWSQALFAAVHAEDRTRGCARAADCTGPPSAVSQNSVRAAWALRTAREYGYSISSERGLSALVSGERVLDALGSDGEATRITGDVRVFAPGGPRHAVLALRVAGGGIEGDPQVRRQLSAGGSGPSSPSFNFDADAIGLLRGFSRESVLGTRVMVGNLDYRFPIRYVERGVRLAPVFLRSIHGAVFVDAGTAWTPPERRDLRTSVGAELSLDAVLAYYWPVNLTAGMSWRRDRSPHALNGTAWYVRYGRAF